MSENLSEEEQAIDDLNALYEHIDVLDELNLEAELAIEEG